MKEYKGHRDSGLEAYQIFENGIKLRFKNGWIYTYTNEVSRPDIIDTMKILAERGQGLNSFINKEKPEFSTKRKIRHEPFKITLPNALKMVENLKTVYLHPINENTFLVKHDDGRDIAFGYGPVEQDYMKNRISPKHV